MNREAPELGSNEAHEHLVKECLEELALMGFAAWENPRRAVRVDGRWVSLSKSGRGDIHVILQKRIAGSLYGIHGEVECKTGQSTQSTKQRAHMRMVRSSGGVYVVTRDRMELRPALSALGFLPGVSPPAPAS
ncbi:MAG TPA: hypothetical protein VH092_08455 [Urbifossiella sp.]|nr:hypothetical protein [Urbifossiella sp.]